MATGIAVCRGLHIRESDADSCWVGYPSGQREQTVNLPAYAFEGSSPSPTIMLRDSVSG